MMRDKDVIEISKLGMEIGGHTVNHPILSCESDENAYDEMISGKKYLESLLNKKIESFAYPNGKLNKDYKVKHIQMVKKAGFNCRKSDYNCRRT